MKSSADGLSDDRHRSIDRSRIVEVPVHLGRLGIATILHRLDLTRHFEEVPEELSGEPESLVCGDVVNLLVSCMRPLVSHYTDQGENFTEGWSHQTIVDQRLDSLHQNTIRLPVVGRGSFKRPSQLNCCCRGDAGIEDATCVHVVVLYIGRQMTYVRIPFAILRPSLDRHAVIGQGVTVMLHNSDASAVGTGQEREVPFKSMAAVKFRTALNIELSSLQPAVAAGSHLHRSCESHGGNIPALAALDGRASQFTRVNAAKTVHPTVATIEWLVHSRLPTCRADALVELANLATWCAG